MVEVTVCQSLPKCIELFDEKGQLQKQHVHYEWKPVIRNTCKGIGHETGCCKKKESRKVQKPVQKVWVPKAVVPVTKSQVQATQKENLEVLPTLDPAAIVTPMPFQGSVLYSVTPVRFLNSISMGKLSLNPHVETRVKSKNDIIVHNSLGNGWKFEVNNDIRDGGGIWFLWNPSLFNVNVIQKEVQVMHLHVTHLESGFAWVCSMVYGCNKDFDRRELWRYLVQMKASCMDPWLVMGDFNNVLHFDERIGSNITSAETREFQECMKMCGLYDLIVTGAYYTWNNKQAGECRVFSRIDRVMANDSWILTDPAGIANFLPEGLYDNSPCIISLWDDCDRKKNSFKYFKHVG
ncbi:uncharacterized protein LOC141619355 [Silene latifolia]|uniref:uncharacterized protein LOC141619355 n=1 Tax=Silene latifolia TaxID=37657 RepID=UPI003D7864B0